MHLPFALSPSHFISNIGADAGFAALIGLAILVLLYFAHAREAKTQREELEAARQRIEALENRLAAGGISDVVPVAPRPQVSVPATAGAQAWGTPAPATGAGKAPATVSAPLAAPAGLGAPALIDATRVVPAFEEVVASARGDGRKETVPTPAIAAAGAADPAVSELAVPATAEAAAAGTAAGSPPTLSRPAAQPRPPAQPLSAPGGTGAPMAPPADAAPVRPAAGRMPSPVTSAAGGNGSASPSGLESLRPGSLLREGLPGQRWRLPLRLLVPLLAAVAAVVVAVVLVIVLTSGGGSAPRSAHSDASSQMALALRKVAPSSVTVAVLNGTTVNELAHRTGQRLTGKGFKEGQLATASNQSLRSTVVSYLPGHRLAALAVAHALKLTAAAVAPAQAASKALACPGSASCTADVIVTVGSDLAHAP